MFFKVVTFRNKDGSTRQYLHLVEAVREGKKTRHKVLVTLGRVEFLRASGSLDRMADALNRLAEKEKIVDLAKNLSAPTTKVYGPVPVFRRLWSEPGKVATAVFRPVFDNRCGGTPGRNAGLRWSTGCAVSGGNRFDQHVDVSAGIMKFFPPVGCGFRSQAENLPVVNHMIDRFFQRFLAVPAHGEAALSIFRDLALHPCPLRDYYRFPESDRLRENSRSPCVVQFGRIGEKHHVGMQENTVVIL